MRHIAFLRGINVGGRKVPMADLRDCLADAGCTDVRTVLQSGNVALTPPAGTAPGDDDGVAAVRALLEHAISDRFGYRAIVQVLTHDAVLATADGYPFPLEPQDPPEHPYVVFVDDRAVRERLLAAGRELDPGLEEVAPAPTGVYWRVPKGRSLDTPFSALLSSGPVKAHVTTRNLATVRKILG